MEIKNQKKHTLDSLLEYEGSRIRDSGSVGRPRHYNREETCNTVYKKWEASR